MNNNDICSLLEDVYGDKSGTFLVTRQLGDSLEADGKIRESKEASSNLRHILEQGRHLHKIASDVGCDIKPRSYGGRKFFTQKVGGVPAMQFECDRDITHSAIADNTYKYSHLASILAKRGQSRHAKAVTRLGKQERDARNMIRKLRGKMCSLGK